MSARITEHGRRDGVTLRPHATPKFRCTEDVEHTSRCVAAIRRRRWLASFAVAHGPGGELLD